jgi:hypothetical protein
MPSFAVSISILGLAQAALVASPAPRRAPWLERLRSRWLALVPALSIVVAIAAVELDAGSARALSWLALVAVPPLAAAGLGFLVHGARPAWAFAAIPLLAIAWASRGSLAGEAAAVVLTGTACVTLAWMLVSVVPAFWLRLGVYGMAVIDTIYVSADLLQGPNAVLSAAVPGAGLPRLQAVHFGHAQMGFGDLFVAALVGCLLAARQSADGTRSRHIGAFESRRQWAGAVLVAVLALAFDLLFFAVDELPATVPVAVALALVTWREGKAGAPLSCSGPTSSGTAAGR